MAKDLGVYTVEDAIDQIGFGPFQILIVMFTGMIWLSDAMEAMLLSVLSPIVKCEWDLASWQQAMLSSVVFVGYLFGGYFWGFLSDSFGRKKALLTIGSMIFIFGQFSAFSPNYVTLLFFRGIVGFAIGGGSQAVTYYVEFLSSKLRGVAIMLLALWWAGGSISAAALALVLIPNLPSPLDWRLYLCLCSLPIGLVMTCFVFVPESARYYVSKGKIEKGEKVIKRIAWFNRKKPPSGRLVSQEEKNRLLKEAEDADAKHTDEEDQETESTMTETREDQATAVPNDKRSAKEDEPFLKRRSTTPPPPYGGSQSDAGSLSDSSSSDSGSSDPKRPKAGGRFRKLKVAINNTLKNMRTLFINGGWRTTVPLMLIWLGCAWLYYGSVLLSTTILEDGKTPICGGDDDDDDDECDLDTAFYLKVVWTSAAEFPGILLTLVIIEFVGRKKAMALEFAGAALSFALLFICVPEIVLTVFLFCARGFITGAYQAVYVYTPEVYPTKYRGLALGLMGSSSRVGALITPFVAQPLYELSPITTVLMYMGSCVAVTILAMLLPVETKGRSLEDS